MKLVEILARDLNEWPSKQVPSIEQAANGEMVYNLCHPPSIEEMDYKHSGVLLDRASDWVNACITRPQWQAERDRMKAMEEISKFSQEQDQLQHPASTTYEQQLWDRVAKELFAEWSSPADSLKSASMHAATAMNFADAFMAEREKRMKGAA